MKCIVELFHRNLLADERLDRAGEGGVIRHRFDSLVGALSILDSLITTVTENLGGRGPRHIAALDEVRLTLGQSPDASALE